jgi:hypothetical protein
MTAVKRATPGEGDPSGQVNDLLAGEIVAEINSSANNLQARKSWRDVLSVHPAADLFPMMSGAELRELGEDIKRNGLRYPVILWAKNVRDGKHGPVQLLDGRNRLDAMELVGIPIEITQSGNCRQVYIGPVKDGDRSVAQTIGGCDPYEYVISANIYRRHLTPEQKRELIGKLLKAKPESSNLQIAKQVKADDKTVAKVRRELEGRSEIPNVEARTDTKGRKQPAAKPAKVEKPQPKPAKTDPTKQDISNVAYKIVQTDKELARALYHCLGDDESIEQLRGDIAVCIDIEENGKLRIETPPETPPVFDAGPIPECLRKTA